MSGKDFIECLDCLYNSPDGDCAHPAGLFRGERVYCGIRTVDAELKQIEEELGGWV